MNSSFYTLPKHYVSELGFFRRKKNTSNKNLPLVLMTDDSNSIKVTVEPHQFVGGPFLWVGQLTYWLTFKAIHLDLSPTAKDPSVARHQRQTSIS
ncbi:hypothetical protein TNCT_383051 [Trichonephila clavata]|uniref:Uncharacterized protein n=1 Tax=Trichonephila clavata TaxID=2740835 RepID=A0A8X6M2Z5_TRICU|nr:hypothetical protein TNCT_383051 [Trichonephila clavata]